MLDGSETEMTAKPRLIILGPPGSGKGTQARLLAERFNLVHISTGDILRAVVSSGKALGQEAKGYMDRGELVPDGVMLKMIREKLSEDETASGFIFDGFPRTIPQAEGLTSILGEMGINVYEVIKLKVSDDTLINRLTGRLFCPKCGADFNLSFRPPKEDRLCDHCGAELERRADDTEEVIKNRLGVYRRQTGPIEDFYRLQYKLKEVDGEGDSSSVFERILEVITTS